MHGPAARSRAMTVDPSRAVDSVRSCPLQALAAGRFVVDGVVVVRDGRRIHAFEEACPHAGASLAEAPVARGHVVCPAHGARFRLSDGSTVGGRSHRRLRIYFPVVADGRVSVHDTPPADVARRRGWHLRRVSR